MSAPIIRTPDQRVRVFISSTLQELASERAASREAITRLRLIPVMFELGARPHPPRDLYRAYLDQSHIFIGIYWQKYGWIAPDMQISGLEDEYLLSGSRPKLIYIKHPSPDREPSLAELLHRIQADDTVSYKPFSSAEELRDLIENDLAIMLTERFEMASITGQTLHAPAETSPAPTKLNNLPVQRGSLIGREREVAAVRDLLMREDVGLVTLTGPGGSGKTRLALQLGSDLLETFENGVALVPLAAINDFTLVAAAIAQTLEVRDVVGQSALETLKDYLRNKEMLLILDNFEQVVDAAPLVANLLANADRLKVLATSRTPLQLTEEREFPVPPLQLPDKQRLHDTENLSQYAAVELFIQRAIEVKPDFRVTNDNAPAVAEICYRLDGLPLAIELAAARIKILSPQALLARLGSSLDLLRGGARDLPERQQTLRKTISWSYDLLDDEARLFFRRLSVFAGGFTLDAAEAICGGSGIDVLQEVGELINNSLLKQNEVDGEPRFTMLETIREYATERLVGSDDGEALLVRHADFFLRLAEQAEPFLTSRERPVWMRRMVAEYGNLRAILEWSMARQPETALRMAGSLSWYWFFSGAQSEGRRWQEEAITRARPLGRTRHLARCLYGAGGHAWVQGDYALARERLNESEAIAREIGDMQSLVWVLTFLSLIDVTEGHYVEGKARALESLAFQAEVQDPWIEALTHRTLGDSLMLLGDEAEARSHFDRGLAIYRELGDPWGEALLLQSIGMMAMVKGDYATARPILEAVTVMDEAGDRWSVGMQMNGLIFIALHEGDLARARELLLASLPLWREIGSRTGITMFLRSAGAIEVVQGQAERATRLFAAATALMNEIGYRPYALVDPVEFRQSAETARTMLGEEAWAKESAAGQGMGMDEAVEFALERV